MENKDNQCPKLCPRSLKTCSSVLKLLRGTKVLILFDMVYEVLDYDEINMVAAYCGFPVRYPHWKWGMEYERLKKGYEYGRSKIYEMVINSDPCYAYLLESNSFIDQKMVICHVTGHNDFFKNNFAFAHTNRKMINEMANHASRVRRYMDWHGVSEVENFIDCVLSLENLIDINAPYIVRKQKNKENEGNREKLSFFPKNPERDVLAFLMEHAPLKSWQADIVDMVRDEAYYFVPQAMTKIMNEGWASYWHTKLMCEHVMEPSELIDFADRHSSVVATAQQGLNPYKLELELYRDIEDRWNKGQFGADWDACEDMQQKRNWNRNTASGAAKLLQVRKIYNDLTFIDEF